MYTDIVTVHVNSKVCGPGGIKLSPGQIAYLEDSPYVRVLISSDNVSLIDPPSLDPKYLKEAGLLRDGEEYKEEVFLTKKAPEPEVEAPKVEEPKVTEDAKSKAFALPKTPLKKAEIEGEDAE